MACRILGFHPHPNLLPSREKELKILARGNFSNAPSRSFAFRIRENLTFLFLSL
jgi:hypothetical protein